MKFRRGIIDRVFRWGVSFSGKALIAAGVLLLIFTFVSQRTAQAAACSEWNLAEDFRVSPNQANPNPDNCGNSDVWYFKESSTLLRDPMTYGMLPEFINDAFSIPGLQEWQDTYECPAPCKRGTPAVSINATGIDRDVLGIWWPAGVVRVHPTPSQLVIVGWKSPISGIVEVTGGVNGLHGCSDGILWFIDHFDGVTNKNLASGSIPNMGSQNFQDGVGGTNLASVTVKQGDFLYFLVDPGSTYYCDSTGLNVIIKPICQAPFIDDFSNPTFTAANWSPATGTWGVETGEYSGTNLTDWNAYSFLNNTEMWDNYAVSVRVYPLDPGYRAGLLVRVRPTTVPSGNDYDYYQVHTFNGGIRISKIVNGGGVKDWYYSGPPIPSNAWHTLAIQANGNNYKFYVNGILYANVIDTSFPTGKIGLRAWTAASTPHVHFDNVVVRPPDQMPVAVNDAFSATEDLTFSGDVLANDTGLCDGGIVVTEVSSPLDGLTLNSDGTFTYLHPTPNFNGQVSFGYRVCDADNNCSEATATINVGPFNDMPVVLLCSNAVINEGETFACMGSFVDPDLDIWTVTVDYGDGSGTQPLTLNPDKTFQLSQVYADNGNYPVTVVVYDGGGRGSSQAMTVTVNNVAPSVGPITAPFDPVRVGTSVEVNASFTDPGILDTHTATWDWGDGNITSGSINESDGSGTVTGSYVYALPGVYGITLTVTDKDGASGTATFHYVVVYDPDGGFVTGGGWINSPAGAYTPNPSLTGKATFGFVSKYKKGATIPTGETEFKFRVANLSFHSDNYEWLVVAGAKAMYKGTGTINGQGSYQFILSAIDADINPNDSFNVDRFRIKIWYENPDGDETVVYDNALDDDDDLAMIEIGGGSIVIHKQ